MFLITYWVVYYDNENDNWLTKVKMKFTTCHSKTVKRKQTKKNSSKMKKAIVVSVIMLLSFSALFAQDEQSKEVELIKQVIQSAYVDGLCNNADEDAVEKGFHPGFEFLSAGKGNTIWKLPIYNWMEIAKEGEAKGNKYSFQDEYTTVKFLFIDIAGNVAVAKIEFYEGEELNYIDYLSLMKFEDGWRIVSKMAHRVEKEEN